MKPRAHHAYCEVVQSELGHLQRWEVVQSELASQYILYTRDLRTLEQALRLIMMHQPTQPFESSKITPVTVTAVTEIKMFAYLAQGTTS